MEKKSANFDDVAGGSRNSGVVGHSQRRFFRTSWRKTAARAPGWECLRSWDGVNFALGKMGRELAATTRVPARSGPLGQRDTLRVQTRASKPRRKVVREGKTRPPCEPLGPVARKDRMVAATEKRRDENLAKLEEDFDRSKAV